MMTLSHSEPLEHDEQVGLCRWMDLKFPHTRYFAIPNGELRAPKVASRLKAEGVSPGVPDLMIPAWFLFVEMKRKTKGRVSPEQKEWHTYLRLCGYHVIIGKGAEDASRQILAYWNDHIRYGGRAIRYP